MHKINKKAYELGNFKEYDDKALKGSTIRFTTTEDITKDHAKKVLKWWYWACPDSTLVYDGDKDFYNTVKYAIKNKLDIVLCSQHIKYSKYDQEEKQRLLDVIQEAKDNNVFIAIASGNDREDIDDKHYIEALEGLVTIGAVDVNMKAPNWVSYGECVEYVDIGILYNDEEEWFDKGTSFAQPLFQAKIARLIDYFKTNKIKYSYDLIYKIVNDNVIKLKDNERYGKGFFKLPPISELEKYKGSDKMEYIVDNIPLNTPHNRRTGTKRVINGIVVHNTGNPSSTALNERSWLTNPNNTATASYNYVIDAHNIIQCIPDDEVTYNAGDGTNGEGNVNYISVEICESGTYTENERIAKEFIVDKLIEYNLPINNVKPHQYFSGKNCPRLILPYWNQFVEEITYMYNQKKNGEISEWAKDAQKWVIEEGISDGTRPKDNVTREELWTMLYRNTKK